MIEVIAIGDELLAGITANTNAAFLSAQLYAIGFDVSQHLVLPDNPGVIEENLRSSLGRSSLVLVTGGLGPTCDDHTRSIAAKIFESPFHYDERIAKDLRERFGEKLASLQDQATVPTRAALLLNRIGTAPGMIFQRGEKRMILMPGVPSEMQPMFTEQVLPYLHRVLPSQKRQLTEQHHLCLLSENEVDPLLRELKQEFSNLSIGIYPGYGVLTVVFKSVDPQILTLSKQRLSQAFGRYLFPSTSGKIEEALHAELQKQQKTLAFAESCTGGVLAHKITALPGASQYFLGSIVAYSSFLKETLLSVPKEVLVQKGAVSEEAVDAMLQGVLRQTEADYGIAVSGIAGPEGGTPEKPVGTIYAAYGKRGQPARLISFLARGNRETIILSTTNRLISLLWLELVEGGNPPL